MGAAKDSNPKPIKQTKPVAAAASIPAARGKARTSSSATGIASPPIEKNETTSPPRQKRWATKTRTGCITCRIRRVKCDEGRPMCKRCITSGRMCDGYNKKRPVPPTPAEQSPQSDSLMTDLLAFDDEDRSNIAFWTNSKAVQNSKIHDPGPTLEIIPPDWDLVEAFEYFYRIILPSFISGHLEEGTSAYMPSAANLGCKTSFITFVFSNRIADVAKKRGTLRSPEDMPLDQYLWTAFHASMAKMLQIINDGLSSSDDEVVDSMLTRIADILSTDLTLQGTSWQAHLRGYGTLFKLRGGYKRLSKTVPTFPSQMQYVFLLSVFSGTTTPAAQQLTIFEDLEPHEIQTVVTFSLYTDLPCPSYLIPDIIRITRLRALVSAGASINNFVLPAARQIYNHISAFSPENWKEPPLEIPNKPEMPLLGRIFQMAVLLYGLLTLPSLNSSAAAAAGTGACSDNVDAVKQRQQRQRQQLQQSRSLPSPDVSGAEADAGTAESNSDSETMHDDDDDADMAMSDNGTNAAALIPSIGDIRRDLLDTITQVLPLVEKRPSGLTWPLAVLGVSLASPSDGDDVDMDMGIEADTNAADRELVAKTLYDISLHRDAYYGPVLCRSKLRAFWASGKTGWEDCYDEPCSVLS